MDYREFLLEIGVEDLPPAFVKYGREHIARAVPELFKKHRLEFEGFSAFASPRRLAFALESCATRQADSDELARGPAVRVAYDAEGRPTKAAIGFARSMGVDVGDLGSTKTPKGEYVTAKKRLLGRAAVEVIPDIVRSLLESFSFPKMMRWTDAPFAFGRPVRWLVVLFGDELVKCSVFGVSSSRNSRGVWTQNEAKIRIADAGSYLSEMERHSIIVSHERREEIIRAGIKRIEQNLGCEVVRDEEMLSILADSVDSPRVSFGDFDARFLELPEPVLTTCLWHHQFFLATRPKFFAKPSGGFKVDAALTRLLPHFVALLGNPDANEDQVRAGNEAVLEARLDDAAFFFAEDKRASLDSLLPRLKGMALHKGLGDLLMKSRRLKNLAPRIAALVFAGQDDVDGVPIDEFKANCGRAGELCKADLITRMVGEFPELQGIMGGIYAKVFGESDEVCDAISEHYRPRGADDEPPKTHCGRILALADKLDSLCAFFGAGHVPKGSQDPFGLRREAFGVVRIIHNFSYKVSLLATIQAAISGLEGDRLLRPAEGLPRQVLDFVKQRLLWVLTEEEQTRNDLALAVVSHESDDIYDLVIRAHALNEFSKDEQFDALMTGLKRASNILKGETWGKLNPGTLVEEQETRLFDKISEIEAGVYQSIGASDYQLYLRAFRLMAGLRPFIDDFFDNVMVMVEDEALRRNRLALLARLTKMFGSIADFSRIVVEKK